MSLAWSSIICLFLLASVEAVSAAHIYQGQQDLRHSGQKQFQKKAVSRHKAIIVDKSGHGDFSKIQSAIDSVPSNNKHWVHIKVKAGIYREKVNIPGDKPHIVLQGEGKKKTIVDWADHDSSAQSPTFLTMANNIVVKSMSFRFIFVVNHVEQNSYNYPKYVHSMTPAVAAMISGDKSSFHNVGFYGLQDTLWDEQGRHYFNSCTIQGAMDFIFGTGQSLYERCSISVLEACPGEAVIGFITAQGRTGPNDANGFVFKNCNIHGFGKTYLGRPWRGYARVLFYQTKMSDIVQPLGWQPWNSAGHEGRITFAEEDNFGPGSNTSQRVSWLKKLSPLTVKEMTSTRFVDMEGWLNIHHRL
ncbi:unnamed protein product [Sphenostylis stenocarpa]|uniref:pectinesterase n=1 Tax=Sphenostylis stenocarpa TaxID=92480 RepID=A0AA86S332_9FABA|nr:unnamed protein product [Sphenostylis stenocarpa]